MACSWIPPVGFIPEAGGAHFTPGYAPGQSFLFVVSQGAAFIYGLRGAAPAGGPVPSPFVRARAAPTSLRVVHRMLDALDMSCAPIMEPRAAVPLPCPSLPWTLLRRDPGRPQRIGRRPSVDGGSKDTDTVCPIQTEPQRAGPVIL
jgi:hypothetical protein